MSRETSADGLRYLCGFGNTHESEAVSGALPRDQNSPRRAPYGLYAEQLNGTGFTVRRADNRRVWMYRIRPRVATHPYQPFPEATFQNDLSEGIASPEPMRWRALPAPRGQEIDWLGGVETFGTAGEPDEKAGFAIHIYVADAPMVHRVFCNQDADMLFIPELGSLRIQTELGILEVAPREVAVVPRGVVFRVDPIGGAPIRGFVAEVYDGPMTLPERGALGPNGLADPRHFLAPVAAFEDRPGPFVLVVRHRGELWRTTLEHSPFDVVAWHGNFLPYKYDLTRFNTLGSVSFDHPDPSILTVLTCPSGERGRSALDLAVFLGDRWDVAEHTFRPPFFHRNSAVEFNAVIETPDDASAPFAQGTFTYTPYLSPHGVSREAYAAAIAGPEKEADRPARVAPASVWIQLESTYMMRLAPWMVTRRCRDRAYLESFAGFPPAVLP